MTEKDKSDHSEKQIETLTTALTRVFKGTAREPSREAMDAAHQYAIIKASLETYVERARRTTEEGSRSK